MFITPRSKHFISIMSAEMSNDKQWTIVGVSGVTCGGKTTFAGALRTAFPDAVVISQDDYFLPPDDPRHTHIPSLGHINWEISSALDMVKMTSDMQERLSMCVTLAGGQFFSIVEIKFFRF